MKPSYILLITIFVALSFACGQKAVTNTASNSPRPTATNVATNATPPSVPDLPTTSAPAPTPRDGDYEGKGVVTKINLELGSVEVNHKEIKDLMPAMTMEFFVSDKNMLDGLKFGDEIDFVIRYKDRNETIVKITKSQ